MCTYHEYLHVSNSMDHIDIHELNDSFSLEFSYVYVCTYHEYLDVISTTRCVHDMCEIENCRVREMCAYTNIYISFVIRVHTTNIYV